MSKGGVWFICLRKGGLKVSTQLITLNFQSFCLDLLSTGVRVTYRAQNTRPGLFSAGDGTQSSVHARQPSTTGLHPQPLPVLLDCLILRTEPRASGMLRKCLTSELSLQSLQQTFTRQLSASKFSVLFHLSYSIKHSARGLPQENVWIKTFSHRRRVLFDCVLALLAGCSCLQCQGSDPRSHARQAGTLPQIYTTKPLFFPFQIYFYFEYFPCIYICAPCVSLRRSEECLELQMAVNHPTGTRNLTWVFRNRSKCS